MMSSSSSMCISAKQTKHTIAITTKRRQMGYYGNIREKTVFL